MAFADPRAYIRRLDDVVGPGNWHVNIDNVFTISYRESRPREGGEQELVEGTKLVVVCTLEIAGLGQKTDIGEARASDENAATSAFAQAFKRACAQFGIGRYLYDLPRYKARRNPATGKLEPEPKLPEWAIPVYRCEDTGKVIQPVTVNGKHYSVSEIVRISRQKYGKVLSFEAMVARKRAAAKSGNEDKPAQVEQVA